MYDAIVLAGGKGRGFDAGGAPEYEALVNIGGRPMLSYVVSALERSTYVDRIFVAGPVAALACLNFSRRVTLVQSGENVLDTFAAGVRAAGAVKKFLVVTADIPLLSGDAVDAFVALCGQAKAELYYPVVGQEDMCKSFPGSERTYVRFKEGAFTGGNLFLADARILPRCMETARRINANRKKPWRLAAMLGWTTLAKFALRRLSLEDARSAAERLLNVRGCVVRSAHAAVGMDVDKSSDLELVKKYISC